MVKLSFHDWRRCPAMALLVGLGVLSQVHLALDAADEKAKTAPAAKLVATPPKPEALLVSEGWQKAPVLPVKSEELDRLIKDEWERLSAKDSKVAALKRTALTTDEQFLRRVTLDLVGKLPSVDEMNRFAADQDVHKRAKAIDRLLDSEDFASHWANYWGDVVGSRVNTYMRRLQPIFEDWLFEQFKKNAGWGEMVRQMLTAEAVLSDHLPQPAEGPKQPINGAAFFIAPRFYEKTREEGAVDAAAETSRVFLGIQIQCAQCHDDRSGGQWERVQFHQLAAFFGRSCGRPKHPKFGGQGALDSWALVYYPTGEYEMPDARLPNKSFLAHPTFLDGSSPGTDLSDKDRRQALAKFVTDKNNFWFSAAFINRIWYELMGQGFYRNVDDLGPSKDVDFPAVLARLGGAFRASDYNVKDLIRTITNSQTYQRQFRMGETPDEPLYFTGTYPTRIRGPVVWSSLASALDLQPPKPRTGVEAKKWARFLRQPGPQELVVGAFDFDPSQKPEGSLTQVLLMMNASYINSKIDVQANNVLGRILKEHAGDADAVRAVYQRTLARKPTDRELEKTRKYIAKIGNRNEAFEDILWALINSPEFQVKR